jgi:uncharacterized protein (TIGR02722 family)
MNARRSLQWVLILTAVAFLLSACGPSRAVSRRSAGEAIDLSGKWNDTDSRLMAEEMIKDVVNRPWLDDFRQGKKRKPIVIPFGVKNRTTEHINTQTFVKDLERALLNSGRVRVVSTREQRKGIRTERADQQAGLTQNPTAIGKELGADFVLTGELNSIQDRSGGEEVIFYQGNMELISVETNEKVWIGDKKIKKLISRKKSSLF